MKRLLLPILCLLIHPAFAQPTWSGDIANILYSNCTDCHNPNGIAPFSLIEYQDALNMASAINGSVQSRSMPPWTADTTYKRYLHERLLTQAEIDAIEDWVTAGAPEGDPNDAPPPPTFSSGAILENPDLVIKMPAYRSKAVVEDDYVCIAVPSELSEDRKIKAIEVVPGNRAIVHHALIFVDPSGNYQTDTIGGDCGGPTSGYLVTTYAPGGQPTVFPNGDEFKTGISMPQGSNIIFSMHYPEGSNGEWDSTEVHIFFHDEGENDVREIYADRLVENWSFCIPANQKMDIAAAYPSFSGTTNAHYSLLSVLPHMHLLGDHIKSYMVLPDQDTVPLVNIPKWDFEWQDAYFFRYPQRMPSGSRLVGVGAFDNTASNPHNPNDPPIQVCAGLNTSDEMFLFYYHYMSYRTGDEFVNLDSLMNTDPIGVTELPTAAEQLRVYPNPSSGEMTLEIDLEAASSAGLYIYDLSGRLVNILVPSGTALPSGTHRFTWNGNDRSGRVVPKGVYHYSLKLDDTVYAGRLVRY